MTFYSSGRETSCLGIYRGAKEEQKEWQCPLLEGQSGTGKQLFLFNTISSSCSYSYSSSCQFPAQSLYSGSQLQFSPTRGASTRSRNSCVLIPLLLSLATYSLMSLVYLFQLLYLQEGSTARWACTHLTTIGKDTLSGKSKHILPFQGKYTQLCQGKGTHSHCCQGNMHCHIKGKTFR